MENNKNRILFKVLIYVLVIWYVFGYYFEIDLGISDAIQSANDYARITDVAYSAVVVDEPNSEGKIVVTERLTFDVHAASVDNTFWELWRDLPETTTDGVKTHYKVNSVKQILPGGEEIVWEQSPKLYWDDEDYASWNTEYGPGKWYHSKGPYNEYLNQYECLLFYVDGLYREEITFEIEYEMYNAVLKYNDCADLYISMYSGDAIKYLESFSGEILIPTADMPYVGNYKITTYGTNNDCFPVEESDLKNPGYHTFSFNLSEDDLKFNRYNNYIEFDLVSYGLTKHAFAEYAPSNDYTSDDVLEEIFVAQDEYFETAQRARAAKNTIFALSIIGSCAVFAASFIVLVHLKKKHGIYDVTKDDSIFRDIPSDLDPNFVSAFVFSKDKKKKDNSAGVYASLLLSLARKKYISIDETVLKNYSSTSNKNKNEPLTEATITILHDEDAPETFNSLDAFDPFKPEETLEPLTACERYYFNMLKRHATGKKITISKLRDRIAHDISYTRSFNENMKRSITNTGVALDYFKGNDHLELCKKMSSAAQKMIVWGGIIGVVASLFSMLTRIGFANGAYLIFGLSLVVSGFVINAKSNEYVLFTSIGEREYQKWRGLYNFLKSDTLMNERTVVELPLWEKYLVYATAFGISEKVIKAIKIRCPDVHPESIIGNTYCSSTRIHVHSRHIHSSVRTGSAGSLSHHGGGYGGGSFGGGFSVSYGGGGRGGGGGGGGH